MDRVLVALYTASMNRRFGLFGGSFNPIHFGHLIVARSIRETLPLDELIFLPSKRPPHKEARQLADADHRAMMVRLAIEGEEGFSFDGFDLHREPSYTIDTLAHFQQKCPQAELFWIIGADSLMDLPTWHRARELVEMCSIVTAARSGQGQVDRPVLERAFGSEQTWKLMSNILCTPVIDISSTDIRRRLTSGFSIRYLVPERVRAFIEEKDLYKTPASQPGDSSLRTE